MPMMIDQEILAAAMRLWAEGTGAQAPVAAGDWAGLRESVNAGLLDEEETAPMVAGVSTRDFEIPTADGQKIPVRWYTLDHAMSRSAAVYLHGGGMIAGGLELYGKSVARYVAASGVPILAVGYRLAPEHPHPTPVHDCFAGLRWLVEHASELGIDSARVAVMGDSAGAGLAAGVTLLAREHPVPIAKQILIYPMLDDRNTIPDPQLVRFAAWTYDNNVTGWRALLGEDPGGPDVSELAAPARAQDLSELPPAYLEVGDLDIFRDEGIDYARRLALAGTPIELHVRPGCPHGFDRLVPAPDVAIRAMADRIRVLRAL
jgi:acetyl esterase/lipase